MRGGKEMRGGREDGKERRKVGEDSLLLLYYHDTYPDIAWILL